ncbi:MAG: hypothetical protein IPG38_14425 [Chitinophagaceae bacterium]|nr:hypothetical protein [Chitinophagaceae bacterium]
MKQDRKNFLKQLGCGFMAAGLPGMALAADHTGQPVDIKDFSGEGAPMMKNSGSALPKILRCFPGLYQPGKWLLRYSTQAGIAGISKKYGESQ